MPSTADRTCPAPRPTRILALAAGLVLLGLAQPAPADPGVPAGAQRERPAGLAGVDAYRLDFLGALGLAPMAVPLAPPPQGRNPRPVAPRFRATVAPEPQAIRPVATAPRAGFDQQAAGGESYSLSDAMRDAGWRKATAERLRRMAPERPRY